MKIGRPRIFTAIAISIVAHVVLFAWFRELALWGGLEREAWKFFRIASVSIVALVFAVSVIVRGAPEEKVAGILLCPFPALCLISALGGYGSSFGW